MILALLACTCAGPTRPLTDIATSDDSDVESEPPDHTGESTPPDTGPLDPGAPAFPDVVDIVHVTVKVADVDFAGTDDALQVCFNDADCFNLSKPDWDDNDRAQTDVHVVEGFNVPRADIDRFEIRTLSGGDRFQPECFALSFDGEPMSCQPVSLYLGTDNDDEFEVWTGQFDNACQGCWDTPLTHGPYLGADGDLWFRTDATRRVVVWTGPTAADLTAHTILYPSAQDDFTATVHLGPGTHVVQLRIDDHVSDTYTLTAPETLTRLAFGSCSKTEDQPVFDAIDAWGPDVFLFIGDNHYANSDDLGALRQWYRWSLERPGRSELMQRSSVLATWDDHDFTGNNTDGTEPGKDVALRAFSEYWANPSYGAADTPGVFTRQDFGNAELFLIDDRYWRGLDGTLMGAAQTEWLVESLRDSTADWKLVASGSQWTHRGSSDSWAAFDEAREALFAEMTTLGGVVLLSGDIHRSEFRTNPAPGYALPELTSSPLANFRSTCKTDAEQRFCYDDGNSWVGVEIGQTALVATVFDEGGTPLHEWTVALADLQP